MMIDGKLVDGAAGTFTNINPATEEVIGEVADASKAECTGPSTRPGGRSTRPLVPITRFGKVPAATAGRDRGRAGGASRGTDTRSRVSEGDHLRTTTGCATGRRAAVSGEADRRIPLGDIAWRRDGLGHRRQHHPDGWREPVGVVGAIVPWNFPFEVTVQKLGQALATGNTVMFKPAPNTPFNATRLGRLIAEKTDIPAGVVNVVTASDHSSARSSRCHRRST